VRFHEAPDAALLAGLQSQGVAWFRAARPMASGAYGALVDERALAALEAEARVARVEVDLPLNGPEPLDRAAEQTGVDLARRVLRTRDGTELDGRGTLIADLDTPVFLFHPMFFAADGGVFAWIDVNEDGSPTPGVDAVDLDRNDSAGEGEVMSFLQARAFERGGGPLGTVPSATTLRPGTDWVYLDTNRNRQRDYGEGFEESTPAYGEPIFVVDDANRNGRLDVTERLLRLSTCKVRAALSDQAYFRGDEVGGLISYDYNRDPTRGASAGHATGVAGILVGGVAGVSTWLGLAPGAELLESDNRQSGDMMGASGAIQWAIDQGANVILTEYAPYNTVTLDGSSEEELLLDAALDPVSPAGNLAMGYKHRSITLNPGLNSVAARYPANESPGRLVQFSIHHRSPARSVRYAITLPGGRPVDLPVNARGANLGDGYLAYTISRTTPRATAEMHVIISRTSSVAAGDYELRVTLDGTAPLPIEVYAGDDRHSWGGGLVFTENDPAHTLCHPATSDQTLAVAAWTLHAERAYAGSSAQGELASYSSQGPRIDGEPAMDIAAPDNPMSTTLPEATRSIPYGAFTPFGGTSGAGPHVAAVAALLRQLFPMETATQLRTRIVMGARHDRYATTDAVTRYGAGKLDLANAAGLTAPTGTPPSVHLEAPLRAMVGGQARVSVTVTDDEPPSALRARWDTDYDGTPDTGWIALDPFTLPTPSLGTVNLRVEVRDGQGYVRADTARIEVVAMLPPPPDAGTSAPPSTPDGSCGCAVPGRSSTQHLPWWLALVVALQRASASRRRRVSSNSARSLTG
jgi:subtilisin family serine protease